MASMSGQKMRSRLRGKTGCLTCECGQIPVMPIGHLTISGRSRRKKCDETLPICERCSSAGRVCEYPTSIQMVDRRYASHPRSRHSISPDSTVLCNQSERAAHNQLSNDLEVVVSKHFIEKYYSFLLLPNCHEEFHAGWIQDIMKLMVDNQSLRYSVLANAASHIHNGDSNSSMLSLALSYYSRSINSLWSVLTQASDSFLTSSDGCLMSIMFLYLHGVSFPDLLHTMPAY